MNTRKATAAAEMGQGVAGDAATDRVARLIAHLDRKHAERGRELDAEADGIRSELCAFERDLKASLRWRALRPVLSEARRQLRLLGLAIPVPLFLGFAVAVWFLAGRWIGDPNLTVGIAAVATVASWIALQRYRMQGVRDRIQTKLMRYLGRDDNDEFPFRFELMLNRTGEAPIVGEVGFSNIDEPVPGGPAVLLCDRGGNAIVWATQGAGGWRIQAVDGRPRVPSGRPVGPQFDALLARNKVLRDKLLAGAAVRAATPANILRKDAITARWSEIALPPDIRETLLEALVHFAYGDASAPRGILLKGPPGTGKSMVAQAFADCVEASVFKCSVAELKGRHIGESANNVRELWAKARAQAPAVVFIDECEGAFPARGSDQGDSFTNEVVQTFLTEWDGIGGESRVLVIGATNRSELLDDAVLSRFTDVIELLPPGGEDRRELVLAVARGLQLGPAFPEAAIQLFAGMSGREVRNALRHAMRLAAPGEPTIEHFREAAARMRGKNATRTDDEARWERLVFPDALIRELKLTAQMVREAETLQQKGIPVPRALLLYGPPGTGKTQIARTLANEAGIGFIARSTTELKGQYLGQAASRIAQSFEAARANSPSILFIDEIDALTSARGAEQSDALQAEALTQLLQEMDGVRARPGFVFGMAATNRLDAMDAAVRSRFAKQIEIGLPDEAGRAALLRALLAGRPVAEDLDLAALAAQTEGCSGRDLSERVAAAFQRAVSRTLEAGAAAGDTVLSAIDLWPAQGAVPPLETSLPACAAQA